jgi:hypothetical protein
MRKRIFASSACTIHAMHTLQQRVQTQEAKCLRGERRCKIAIPLSSNAYESTAGAANPPLSFLQGVGIFFPWPADGGSGKPNCRRCGICMARPRLGSRGEGRGGSADVFTEVGDWRLWPKFGGGRPACSSGSRAGTAKWRRVRVGASLSSWHSPLAPAGSGR